MNDTGSELLGLADGILSDSSHDVAIRFLLEHWGDLSGSHAESTTVDKLHRAEKLEWNAPVLSFTLERHGGTVNGSTRAELHHWQVNVTNRTAEIVKRGHRQLHPQSKRLNVKALAREIANLILAGASSEKLIWKDKDTVSVNISTVIPAGYQETTIRRRRNFYARSPKSCISITGRSNAEVLEFPMYAYRSTDGFLELLATAENNQ